MQHTGSNGVSTIVVIMPCMAILYMEAGVILPTTNPSVIRSSLEYPLRWISKDKSPRVLLFGTNIVFIMDALFLFCTDLVLIDDLKTLRSS